MSITRTVMNSASRAPLIQTGDSTHHHDQLITPVSLSTISAIAPVDARSWALFQHRPATERGFLTRMVNTTLPA
jgi:hypothetical protein